MKIKYIICFLLGLMLFGCGISPYREEKRLMFVGFGGYDEASLGENKYQVMYSTGHAAFQDEMKIYDFALLRASELTLEKGFSSFEIYREWKSSTTAVLYIQLTNTNTEESINAKSTTLNLRQKYFSPNSE